MLSRELLEECEKGQYGSLYEILRTLERKNLKGLVYQLLKEHLEKKHEQLERGCLYGNISLIKEMLASGINIDETRGLQCAVAMGQEFLTSFLIGQGALIRESDFKGNRCNRGNNTAHKEVRTEYYRRVEGVKGKR